VGVEIGQLLALSTILIAMSYWRRTDSFAKHAYTANVAVMSAGFVLMGYQLAGFFVTQNGISARCTTRTYLPGASCPLRAR
jgi:hypothetical protein